MGRVSDAKERLMSAAMDLVWEESYGAVTVDDICQRADVKKGSFYYFFQSKADLAEAALEKMWLEIWRPELDLHFSISKRPLERLESMLRSFYDEQCRLKAKHGKVLGCPVASLGSELSTQEEAETISKKLREICARKRRYYESTIRAAVDEGAIEPCDPAESSLALFGLIEGIIGHARVMNDPELIRLLPDMGLNLLRPRRIEPAVVA
jgi:TetR/AcrR family transcriptional repressor of nem operon